MWLLLCDRSDLSALWAYQGLRARGLELELVPTDVLGCALGWEHRLGADGVTIQIQLADGRTIDGAQLRGVVNRVTTLPDAVATAANSGDREYARQELQAFWLSWLAGLTCPILNRATPLGLSGAWLDETEWLVLAARAGLATRPYRSIANEVPRLVGAQALVIGGRIASEAPAEVVGGCRELAELSGTDLLGVEFAPDGSWTFSGATPQPDLSLAGERGLDLLAETIEAAAAG